MSENKPVIEYKDRFTFDGRVQPQRGVTKGKVSHLKGLVEEAKRGSLVSEARLKEAFTSSDLQTSVAHLMNLQIIPQLDKAQYSIDELMETRTVPDFRPVILHSLYGNLEGPGLDEHGAPVRVPEGTQYPTVTVAGEESFYASLAKRGVRFDFTWEAKINDAVGFFTDIPKEIVKLAQDAAYAEGLTAILSAGGSSALVGGVLPNGNTVRANELVTPDAIWQAILELANREINGEKIGTLTGYNVLVPVGRKSWVDYELNKTILQVQDGSLVLGGGSYYQGALTGVTVVESPRFTGTAWALVPKKGSTVRPSVELLKLRGHETPQLRVRNGGEESFDDDGLALRLRYVVGGALWSEAWIVKSTGAGS